MRPHAAALSGLMLLAPTVVHAQQSDEVPPAARQTRSAGVEVYSGAEYQDIELADGQKASKLTVPVTVRVTAGRLRIMAQLPYVRVTSPGNVVVPSGPLGLPILVDPAGTAEVSTRDGMGDLRVGLAYDLPVSAVNLSLNSGVKLPTASTEQALGTGETDYWVGAEASTHIGAVTPFAGVSYARNGDPEGMDLRDTLSGQAGAAVRVGPSTSAHAGYSFAQSASKALRDEQRIFGGVSTAVGDRLSLGAYGSAGVNGPADVGAGVSLGIGLR